MAAVRIVLVGTTHPGNIGAAARAMKTMGLEDLALVAPRRFPAAEATAMASGADDLLARARVCAHLDEALEGCHRVYGASARRRAVPWPEVDPRTLGREAAAAAGRVAVVFGREHAGLTNAELDRCQALVRIPAHPAYSSLNLAAAVQVVAYELRMGRLERSTGEGTPEGPGCPPPPVIEPAPYEELERFYTHLERVLGRLGFLDPGKPRLIMRRLRRLYHRARPEREELQLLRGILSETERRLRPPEEA